MARYFKLTTEEDLKFGALSSVPMPFKILRVSMPLSVVERKLAGRPEWEAWKAGRRPGDKVWPFAFNLDTLAMRKGFVIVREKKVLSVLLTEVS